MPSAYKVSVSLEWCSKTNAHSDTYPRDRVEPAQLMKVDTFNNVLARINTDDVFRTIIAGYGEPTAHPDFIQFISAIGQHPGRFDLVSNGQLLDWKKLRHLDGKIDLLLISVSCINADVCRDVHRKLDCEKVKANIILAKNILKKTALAISLTPLVECIEILPETINWLGQQGIDQLIMSPTSYNRVGKMMQNERVTERPREIVPTHNLHLQELDAIASMKDIALQYWHNRFKCAPRNSDLFINASGDYLYCCSDVSYKHTLGHIARLSVREALDKREKMTAVPEICENCGLRKHARIGEVIGVAASYFYGKARKYIVP